MISLERMNPPQLRKVCRERNITHLLDGRPIDNTSKKGELLAVLGAKKKGKASWKPAKALEVRASEEVRSKFRLRWREKDPQNLRRAEAEGWEYIHPTKGARAEHEVDDNPLTSATEYRELVLMGLPEDIAQERDAYFQEKADAQIAGVKKDLQSDLDKAADHEGGYKTNATGVIRIE